MKITDLSGKNICVLGYGREGKAFVRALEAFAPGCEVTIADKNSELKIQNGELGDSRYWLQLGEGWLENLSKFDILVKSPGVPPSPLLEGFRQKLTNSTQIFLDTIADRGATVIGVTGSKGKSTTSSLIAAILKEADKDTLLVGNIGEPAIAHLKDVKAGTYVVLEMSSYQLMDLTVSPHIAVITSIFPEHLDYHGTLEAYLDAKKHIVKEQKENDMVFFNEAASGAIQIAKEGNGRKIPFSADDAPVTIEETHLIGRHNLFNIGAATLVAKELGVPEETIIKAIKAFHGLPHRLQFLGTHHGIDWVDDAISTTPESTTAGIRALNGRVKTIILGGQDRGYRFEELAHELVEQNIMHAILFPGSGPRIREALEKADEKRLIVLHDVPDMETAVKKAKSCTPEGSICLLSTASPSYGMFKNFEEKGEQFQHYVKQL
jgi:UDP-N-acetylmuramoylalanine--D-glutamate ligase